MHQTIGERLEATWTCIYAKGQDGFEDGWYLDVGFWRMEWYPSKRRALILFWKRTGCHWDDDFKATWGQELLSPDMEPAEVIAHADAKWRELQKGGADA
jgi:hypothetical protein